jgi:hypothetical protein
MIPIITGLPINHDAIKALEKLIEELQAGRVLGVAIAAAQSNGEVGMLVAPGGASPILFRGALGVMGAMFDKQVLSRMR